MANPLLGVFYHWLGGLASGSFYVPFRGVKYWSWETSWLVGGIFSWILAPLLLAALLTRNLGAVLTGAPASSLFWCFTFGVLWGVGGLTFGLTMRYLGLSLGMAVALGLCAAFGTLMPPVFKGTLVSQILPTRPGQAILAGIGLCLAGIAVAGLAGRRKEQHMSEAQQRAFIPEFDLKKGLFFAIISGVMSACFAFGLASGDSIKQMTREAGTPMLWQGLPVLVVVLWGGFATNFLCTVFLNIKNGTTREYVAAELPQGGETVRVPRLSNYLFCALAGITWYFQFFFYSMGETKMGSYSFSSWTLHMASIIIFSTLWGVALGEWRGAGRPATRLLVIGLSALIASTAVIGYGNSLNGAG